MSRWKFMNPKIIFASVFVWTGLCVCMRIFIYASTHTRTHAHAHTTHVSEDVLER